MDKKELSELHVLAARAIGAFRQGQMLPIMGMLALANGVDELVPEMRELQGRIAKLEMLLDSHFPEWEKANIWRDEPLMSEAEAKDIFGK